MSEKHPYYCVEPDCGISDCNECPFSPVVHYKQIKALEKEMKRMLLTHRSEQQIDLLIREE